MTHRYDASWWIRMMNHTNSSWWVIMIQQDESLWFFMMNQHETSRKDSVQSWHGSRFDMGPINRCHTSIDGSHSFLTSWYPQNKSSRNQGVITRNPGPGPQARVPGSGSSWSPDPGLQVQVPGSPRSESPGQGPRVPGPGSKIGPCPNIPFSIWCPLLNRISHFEFNIHISIYP